MSPERVEKVRNSANATRAPSLKIGMVGWMRERCWGQINETFCPEALNFIRLPSPTTPVTFQALSFEHT